MASAWFIDAESRSSLLAADDRAPGYRSFSLTPRGAAILGDELDTGRFQGAAKR